MGEEAREGRAKARARKAAGGKGRLLAVLVKKANNLKQRCDYTNEVN